MLLMIGSIDEIPLVNLISQPHVTREIGMKIAHAKVKVRVEKLERIFLVHGAQAILLPFVPDAQSS
jgi:hypothetical protein